MKLPKQWLYNDSYMWENVKVEVEKGDGHHEDKEARHQALQ